MNFEDISTEYISGQYKWYIPKYIPPYLPIHVKKQNTYQDSNITSYLPILRQHFTDAQLLRHALARLSSAVLLSACYSCCTAWYCLGPREMHTAALAHCSPLHDAMVVVGQLSTVSRSPVHNSEISLKLGSSGPARRLTVLCSESFGWWHRRQTHLFSQAAAATSQQLSAELCITLCVGFLCACPAQC